MRNPEGRNQYTYKRDFEAAIQRYATGKYAGRTGTLESNVHQWTVDYPGEWANGIHIMLDTEELATVLWDQVETLVRAKEVESRQLGRWLDDRSLGKQAVEG